jgi:hypothetical protein
VTSSRTARDRSNPGNMLPDTAHQDDIPREARRGNGTHILTYAYGRAAKGFMPLIGFGLPLFGGAEGPKRRAIQ